MGTKYTIQDVSFLDALASGQRLRPFFEFSLVHRQGKYEFTQLMPLERYPTNYVRCVFAFEKCLVCVYNCTGEFSLALWHVNTWIEDNGIDTGSLLMSGVGR